MRATFILVVCAAILAGCEHLVEAPLPIQAPPEPPVAATFSVNDADLPDPLMFIVYGDMRFTNPQETAATNPSVRLALIDKIAEEQPAAVFINGDLTWHGLSDDYAEYREETRPWRQLHLRIYPALGNHEFAACAEAECLELWWSAFPELRGRRWYSVAFGRRVLAVALDSDASLLPGSEQRSWLEHQLSGIDPKVQVILFVLHHPPVADLQTRISRTTTRGRMSRRSPSILTALAAHTQARIVVSAGHIHNYERFVRDGVTYLVSGGGGAKPYEVDRTPADLYQSRDFPNYHYVRFELRPNVLVGEMFRLKNGAPVEPKIGAPAVFEVRDRFELTLPP